MDTSAEQLVAPSTVEFKVNTSDENLIQQSGSESSEKTLAESTSCEPAASASAGVDQQDSRSPEASVGIDCAAIDISDQRRSSLPAEVGRRLSVSSVQVVNERTDSCRLCITFCTDYGTPLGNTNIFKYLITWYFLMFAMSISAITIGYLSMGKCTVSPSAPLCVFLVGLTGFFGFGGKLTEAILQCIERRPIQWFPRTMSISLYNVGFILLVAEMLILSRMHGTAQATEDEFCDIMFYEYAFWMNFVALICLVLMAGFFLARICRHARRQALLPVHQQRTYSTIEGQRPLFP